MVLAALAGVGGELYLMRQADENPTAFLSLVGKVLPLQITGDPDRPVSIEFTWAPATPPAVSHETKDAPPVIDATPEPATNDSTEFVWGKSDDAA